MIGSIGRSGGVLQVIGGIVPTADYVYISAVFDPGFFTIQYVAVSCMATILQERIKTRSLLTHVPQTKIGSAFINIISDFKLRRLDAPSLQIVSSRFFERRKIKPVCLQKWSVSAKCVSCFSRKD